MFLNNYSPRFKKIKKQKSFLIIKYSLATIFIVIIIITFIISRNINNTISFDDEFYEQTYPKDKSIVKIENARLIGNDKQNRPYMITAETAVKNNINKNIMTLYTVQADISLDQGKWLFLKTEKASYNHISKTLSSKELVTMYYNNGTSLESSNIFFNISSGLVKGNDGIVMYGDWGTIQSDSFTFNIKKQKLRFFNEPSMQIN